VTRAIFVRHAEPDERVRGRAYGRLDVPLSPAGRAHAELLASILLPEAPTAIYTSPLVRALDTAGSLAGALALEPLVCDDLRELDFGELEGLAIAEIVARFPEQAGWITAPAAASFPGGESVAAVHARVLAAIGEIVARHADETIAVIAHSIPIRVVLADALGLDLDSLFRFDLSYGGISVIEWHDGLPFVRVVNAPRL
jgi:broad specificity phosphatase PhoE